MADDLMPAPDGAAMRDSRAQARELADDLGAVAEAADRSREAANGLVGELSRAGVEVRRSFSGLAGPQGVGAVETALSRLTSRAQSASRGIAPVRSSRASGRRCAAQAMRLPMAGLI